MQGGRQVKVVLFAYFRIVFCVEFQYGKNSPWREKRTLLFCTAAQEFDQTACEAEYQICKAERISLDCLVA